MTELMVTVAIVAILAGLAAPQLVQFIRSANLGAAATAFQADLQLARREAIKRNTRVLMCPVGTTSNQCGTSYTQWAKGWYVCYDADFDGQCDATSATNPNPIIARGAIDSSLTLTGPSSIVRFNADGSQGASGASALTFAVKGTWTATKSYTGSIASTGHIAMNNPG